MQNLAKSIFVGLVITLTLLASLYSIQQLWLSFSWPLIALLLSAAPLSAVIGDFFIIGRARTSSNLWTMLVLSSLGSCLVLYFSMSHYAENAITLLLALSSTIGSWIYVFWYSRFEKRDHSQLQKGAHLPSFPLMTLTGELINSNEFEGRKTLMIFYRGNWCPLCTTQIKEIAKSYQQLAKDGVRIALISPQSENHSKKLADKFDVPFEFYVDTDNVAAKKLNIVAENGLPTGLQVLGYNSDTVMPTVVITDATNTILFADLTDNCRVRPEPEVFAEILHG